MESLGGLRKVRPAGSQTPGRLALGCRRRSSEERRCPFPSGRKGFQNVELLRGLWRSIVGEGNIDVQYKRSPAGVQWKKSGLASYLAKYIGKDMETDLNEKRFRCSLGIEIKGQVIWVPLRVPAKTTRYSGLKLRPGASATSGARRRATGNMDGRAAGGETDLTPAKRA